MFPRQHKTKPCAQFSYAYGIDIIECAKVRLLKEQNAMEFVPYICLIDKLRAEIF